MSYAESGALYAEVVATERLSPHLVRIVLGGPEMSQYEPLLVPDEAVVLWFPKPGQERPAPTTLKDGVWAHHDPQTAPPGRNYTVRAFEPGENARMTVDFVVHPGGVAGEWAVNAQVGQELLITRPRCWYSPPEGVDWILAAADLTGLPALARIIEECEQDGPAVYAMVETVDADDLAALPATQCHARGVDASVGTGNGVAPGALADLIALKVAELSGQGTGYVWYSGEAAQSREIRKLLRKKHGWPLERVATVGYWRQDAERWNATFEKVHGEQLVKVYYEAIEHGLSSAEASELLDEEYEKAGL
ncbi:siderophore-interacting protein [Kineosporia sp. J2-2]|uniref:Siderophore-interacting protein n=1 Tax=Kineosporia corallincola TaxID=2835133 RepID=A0ABS5TRZ5_9ACTN|nr:siderophore-interacting protein [Kineosporia corallincola]MBT0773576.1 siderophore-interacting protein [Kineosporia corallincola]